jgi:hypothetical protein
MRQKRKPDETVSLGRHQRNCSVCAHKQREEIEAAFIGWCSGRVISGYAHGNSGHHLFKRHPEFATDTLESYQRRVFIPPLQGVVSP